MSRSQQLSLRIFSDISVWVSVPLPFSYYLIFMEITSSASTARSKATYTASILGRSSLFSGSIPVTFFLISGLICLICFLEYSLLRIFSLSKFKFTQVSSQTAVITASILSLFPFAEGFLEWVLLGLDFFFSDNSDRSVFLLLL